MRKCAHEASLWYVSTLVLVVIALSATVRRAMPAWRSAYPWLDRLMAEGPREARTGKNGVWVVIICGILLIGVTLSSFAGRYGERRCAAKDEDEK